MRFIYVFIIILMPIISLAEKLSKPKFSTDSILSLRGKECSVIIVNNTKEKILLKGSMYYYLPISEQTLAASLLPGKRKKITLKFNYPDFIQLSSPNLKIYNVPGKTVECDIENISPLVVKFKGDLIQENNYYQEYFKVARNNQIYYELGAKMRDFNHFAISADSINEINIGFLKKYKPALPQWFSKQEYWRIMYNNAFLKYHVPFDMAFKSGQEVKLNNQYYDFDKQMVLINPDAPFSSEYLWYAVFRFRRQALLKNPDNSLLVFNMLSCVDSAYGNNPLGDVIKMRFLYDNYSSSKKEYEKLVQKTSFVSQENKQILDSISEARYSVPLVGKPAPNFKLISFTGDSITLANYNGHKVIINFWASWCSPCIKEFPFENKLYNLYKSDLKLIIINICVDSPYDAWKTLSTQNQLQMINLYADSAQYEKLKNSYNIVALPKSVLIDEDLNLLNNNFKRASEVSILDFQDINN